jgi:hypothetical protein
MARRSSEGRDLAFGPPHTALTTTKSQPGFEFNYLFNTLGNSLTALEIY